MGTVWHTPQRIRLKTDDTLMVEDGMEDSFSLTWFAGQRIASEVEHRVGRDDSHILAGEGPGGEIVDLFQTSSRKFAAGQHWNITNILLPRRMRTYSMSGPIARNWTQAPSVRVEGPDKIEVTAAQFEPGFYLYGRVATNAEAVVAQWTRKFAGPVRIRYVDGDLVQVVTGLMPESIVLGRFSQQADYMKTAELVSVFPLDRNKRSFSGGQVTVSLPSGSGELEIRFGLFDCQRVSLNRDWKFLSKDSQGAWQTSLDESAWTEVQLPHSERAHDEPATNINWFRRHFELPPDSKWKRVVLEFEGVAIQCDVWVNNKKAGDHLGAFNSFQFDITPYLNPPGIPNVLAVRVDFSR